MDELQHRVQALEAQAKSQDLSMAIEDLMTIMVGYIINILYIKYYSTYYYRLKSNKGQNRF